MDTVQQTCSHPLPPPSHYSPTTSNNDNWSFFPNLPLVHGIGNYAADSNTSYYTVWWGCLPSTRHFFHLLPAWCLLWFWGHEALWITQASFRDFHVQVPNATINPCVWQCLQVARLLPQQRASKIYKHNFFVDLFHWKGHVGCSRGYCVGTYKNLDTQSINSQINEQANAGLQRIKGQLAYMKARNFMFTTFLFLAITKYVK